MAEPLSALEERGNQANHNHHQFSTGTQEPIESYGVGLEELSEREWLQMGDSNGYIWQLIVDSGLHLLCHNQIHNAYSRGKERGCCIYFLITAS